MEKLMVKLPDTPGVYFFKKGREILYIGRATSLRDRVRSYFRPEVVLARGPIISEMVRQSTGVSYRVTDSVFEAIILEAELIKKHQPKYNSREKDNKSFSYVVITKENAPRVLQVRGRQLGALESTLPIRKTFGPFPSARELKEVLRVANHQLGLYPGIYPVEITPDERRRQAKYLEMLLSGRKRSLITLLRREMTSLARRQEFERAGELKRKIFALEHIRDVGLIKRDEVSRGARIEAYDISHMSGGNSVGVMVVLEGGEPVVGEYRKFKIRGETRADDLRALREVVERRLNHPEWPMPDLIVVDGAKQHMTLVGDCLKKDGLEIPVVAVVKDERHRPKNILGDAGVIEKYEQGILLANSEAHNYAIKYFRKLVNKIK